MIRRIACLVALAFCSSTASACINDEEAPSHEREFRSSYMKELRRHVGKEGEEGGRFLNEAWLYAGGAAMVVGALAFSAKRERAASGRKPCHDGTELA